MASQGYYRFEHSYLSRAGNKYRGKSGNWHLSDVASYISNENKVVGSLAVNLPTDRGELYSQLNKHNASVTRKNGRIAETFIICFDKRMSDEHQQEALHRFLMSVTFEGRTRATAFRHGDHPDNPHAHVILIDADENGEPVGHFSRSGSFRREHSPVKGNPTRWLRKVWEDECNHVLEAHGYDFRVDMRSNIERGLEEAGKHRGADKLKEPKRDLPEKCPPMPVDAEQVETYPDHPETPEVDMVQTVRDRVGFAVEMYRSLQIADDATYEVGRLERLIKSTEAAIEAETENLGEKLIEREKAEQQKLKAEERLPSYQKADGKLRGFALSLGKWKWRSKTRREADEALLNVDSTRSKFEQATIAYSEVDQSLEGHKNRANDLKDRLFEAKNNLSRITAEMGNVRDIETAKEVATHAMHTALKDIEPEKLLEMVQDGEIDPNEYQDALKIIGTEEAKEMLEQYEAEQSDTGGSDGGQGL